MAYTHVDTPFRIKGLTLKNRIVRAAHGSNLGKGRMSDDLIAFHEARARGGAALTIIEPLSVHRSSNSLLNSWTPGIGDGFRKLVDSCKPHGMKLFQQIRHAGIHHRHEDGGPPWSSHDLAGSKNMVVPVPMTKAMIDEVVQAYARTARLCEEWGLDGVEVQCAHSYLPHQFLSPAYNRRTDDYGGSFQNRMRFILEVLDAVRGEVSHDFVVGIRISPDYQIGSLPAEEALKAVQMLEARALIDFIDVSAGNYQTDYKMIGGMDEPVGYQLATSTTITRNVALPSIVSGRIRTLDDADLILREGDADLVAMTRATIADPDLVAKSLSGKGTSVRPCIGCNQACVGGIMVAISGGAGQMGCTVNPVVGYERTLSEERILPAAAPRKVLVIGGGVAGMEAARVAALRGHRVTLCEANRDLGGMAAVAARAPTRHGIHDIVVWLEQEIYRLGVEVRLSTYMDASDILAEASDAVIVATGSEPRMDGIVLSNPGEPASGVGQPHVLSSVDLFSGNHGTLGKGAVVVDDVGHYEALGVAEELLGRGLHVHFVTRHAGVGHQLDGAYVTAPTLGRFPHDRFTAHPRSHVLSIASDSVEVAPVYLTRDADVRRTLPADTVVLVSLNRPRRQLADELASSGVECHLIGDAKTPRFMENAMAEGHRVALKLFGSQAND